MNDEQKKRLWKTQKETLDEFLRNGALTRAQYDKSLGDLSEKMGIGEDILSGCGTDTKYRKKTGETGGETE